MAFSGQCLPFGSASHLDALRSGPGPVLTAGRSGTGTRLYGTMRAKKPEDEETAMSLLRRLRGEPRFAMPCLGRTLTLYRQGSQLGLLTGLGTVALFNLPWDLVAGGEEVARPLVAVAGAYLAATLIASRAPVEMDARDAASRWL